VVNRNPDVSPLRRGGVAEERVLEDFVKTTCAQTVRNFESQLTNLSILDPQLAQLRTAL
jgi:hypothetical protein